MHFPLKPSAFLFACVVSAVIVLPFSGPKHSDVRPFAWSIEIATDRAGVAQIYYDLGAGFNERDSVRFALEPGDDLVEHSIPLPAGTYRAIRFDPMDRNARITFRNARITDEQSRVQRVFSPADFSAQHQIVSLRTVENTVQIETSPDANDPTLAIALPQPLALTSSSALDGYFPRALVVFVVTCVLLVAYDFQPAAWRRATTQAMPRVRNWLTAHPAKAVALVAAIAVVTSCYPVVFFGKSFVSPNFSDNTHLLYEEFPTLPGYKNSVTENAQGSDVGAIIWADVPYSFVQHDALVKERELPLWNRYNSSGTMLLGQGQSMFGDPLHCLVVFARGAAWAWDLKFLLAKWLLCLGVGLTVLRTTRHLPAGILAALSAAFLGFFSYRLNHPAFFSFCYAPWILYGWALIVEARGLRALAVGAGILLVACIFELHSGTVKEAYMLLLGLNVSGVFMLFFAARPWRERLLGFAAAAWAGVLLLLLTAPSWLTFAHALTQAYTAYNLPTAFQIDPSVMVGLFDEVFYRPIQSGNRVFNPSANFVVLAGVLYFLAAFRVAAASPMARALAWSALPSIALVFGLVPPQWIVKIPFIGNVAHIDNSFSCVLIVLLAVLAGFGWKAAFERLGTPDGRGDLARVGWAYVLLVFPWIAFTQVVHRPIYGDAAVTTLLRWGQRIAVDPFVWTSLLALSLAGMVLLMVARYALARQTLGFTSTGFIVLAMIVLLWRHGMHTTNIGPGGFVFTPAVRADFHASSPAIEAIKQDQTEPARVVGLRGNLFPGWSSAYGLEGISGPDALINHYYRELISALGLDVLWEWRIYITPTNVSDAKPALDFLNVRHYADLRSDQGLLGQHLTPVRIADLDVYRSETTWPRAFFTSALVAYETPQELAATIRHANGTPFASVQRVDLPGNPPLAPLLRPDGRTASTSRARDYNLTANSTSFTIDADGPGVAVLHETWLDGDFHATLDGSPVTYFRANHAFKGIVIPSAGIHRVEFTYRPRSFDLTLGLSAMGAVLGLSSGFIVWRRTRDL